MEEIVVSKFPIMSLVIYFVIYIGLHYAIGVLLDKTKKFNIESPGNAEKERLEKILKPLFKFFPMLYVVFILLVFLL